MKAHEETWVYDGRWLQVHPPEGETYGERWACADYGDAPGPRARLAAAAPEMARLLLEIEFHSQEGDEGHLPSACPICDGYEYRGHKPDCRLVAVLRKAGVIADKERSDP